MYSPDLEVDWELYSTQSKILKVTRNCIHLIWKQIENYIWLGLKFWRRLRTMFGSVWYSDWELYLAWSDLLEAIKNYILLNLKFWRWLRTIFDSVWSFGRNWELYSAQSEIMEVTENYIQLGLIFWLRTIFG